MRVLAHAREGCSEAGNWAIRGGKSHALGRSLALLLTSRTLAATGSLHGRPKRSHVHWLRSPGETLGPS